MLQALIAAVRGFSPKLAKVVGPMLAAWVAKPDNRQRAMQILKEFTSQNATTRLEARLELAQVTLEELANDERTNEERRIAANRALDEIPVLRSRLRLPFTSVADRRRNRRRVAEALQELLRTIDESL